LIQEQLIQPFEKEYYCYGIEITIANFIDLFLALAIGYLFSGFFEIILFLIVFIGLRYLTGGLHAQTYASCLVIFLTSCTLALLLIQTSFPGYEIILLLIGFLISPALFFAPIVNDRHPLSDDKIELFHLLSTVIGFCILFISGILFITHLKKSFHCVIIAFITVNLFILIEKRN